jgi:hypothetical protein
MIVKPHVDWFALSPSLALIGTSGLLLMAAVFVPRLYRKPVAAFLGFAGFVASGVFAGWLDQRTPHGQAIVHDAMFRDRWAALAQVILAGSGAVAIVLAAMDMLRAISGVLHQDVGPAVPAEALDLRPAELGFVVPLVACLLVLSAWPNGIAGNSFGNERSVQEQLAGSRSASPGTNLSQGRNGRYVVLTRGRRGCGSAADRFGQALPARCLYGTGAQVVAK